MKNTSKKVLQTAVISMLVLAAATACNSNTSAPSAPDFHAIEPDTSLETLNDYYGSDAFGHMGDHADSRYYVINDFYNMKSDDTLHIIPNFETYQQTTEYTCGPSAALTVLNHYGVTDYNEMQLADMVDIDQTKGTSVEGMIKLFEDLGYEVDSNASTEPRFASEVEAEEYMLEKIDAGIPVMIDWSDWYGHWQALIGIDTCGTESAYDDVMIFADPYDVTDHYQDGYYTYPYGRFFYQWREGGCAQKKTPYEQPFVVALPKD